MGLALGLELPFDVAEPVAQLGRERVGLRMRHTSRYFAGISLGIPRHVTG
jgi:hypothetical protein